MEDYFDALRFGLPRMPALAHRLDKETSGCLVLGRHRKALADLNLLFRNGKVGKTYWAVVEGGPGGRRGPHRHAARPARRHPRLVDEARSGRPAVATTWKVMGRADGLDLARARAAHRPDAPVARALLGDGLSDPRRQHLRQRAAPRAGHASARARDRGAALQEQAADQGHGAGAAAHEGAAEGVRVGRGTGQAARHAASADPAASPSRRAKQPQ